MKCMPFVFINSTLSDVYFLPKDHISFRKISFHINFLIHTRNSSIIRCCNGSICTPFFWQRMDFSKLHLQHSILVKTWKISQHSRYYILINFRWFLCCWRRIYPLSCIYPILCRFRLFFLFLLSLLLLMLFI